MEHDRGFGRDKAFRTISFSDKVRRCLDRAATSLLHFRPVSLEEARIPLGMARQELSLAPDDVIATLLAKNPDILRAVFRDKDALESLGLFAYLPLSDLGYEAVVTGTFTGARPHPDWICGPGEAPTALYLWMVYLPGALGQSIGVIARAFDELAPASCAVFSRAVNAHAERLNRSMGFMPAQDFFPDAPAGILVVFPQRELPKHEAQKRRTVPARTPDPFAIKIARNFEDMFKVLSIRSATYLAEQFCYFEEEFDGNDFCATHLLGHIGADPAGCVRVRFFNGFAKIERLAVRSEYRNSKLAFALARGAIEHCRMKGYTRIYGHSRLDLVRFWSVFGFREMQGRADFTFANIVYRELILDSDGHVDAIGLDADPMVLIRPEGAWDRPGPLDISASEHDVRRRDMIEARTRTVKGISVLAN